MQGGKERVSRYHEGTNSVRGRKNGRGDKERKENVEPTLGLIHSFISPDLRHQVVELGPQILREKKWPGKKTVSKVSYRIFNSVCRHTSVDLYMSSHQQTHMRKPRGQDLHNRGFRKRKWKGGAPLMKIM